ncbi:hypothetical protein JP0037_14150 [Helicobacter pylori]|nr:hypothetical protein JP0037_14150 [Helicobacter pylori]GHR23136.1 hypothetical protein JP0093_12920 [Helicobacter pylori]GHS42454.1 hypothetical protein JP0123_11630 [Helicobacter pylori]
MNPIKTNTQGAWQSLALTLGLKFPISFNNGDKKMRVSWVTDLINNKTFFRSNKYIILIL